MSEGADAGAADVPAPLLPNGFPPPFAAYEAVGRVAVGTGWSEMTAKPPGGRDRRLTPYRPDSAVDGWDAGAFQVRAATVRGDSHRYYGIPRQDEMSLAWQEETELLVVAVADGVSSAPLSHLGAGVACRYALEYLLREGSATARPDWRQLLEGSAWALIEAGQRLESLADPDPARAEQDFATTLCVATVAATGSAAVVRAASVGDSGLALLRDSQLIPLLGGKAPQVDGITDTSVVPLPRLPETAASGEWTLEPGDTLLIGTDGIWDPVGDGTGTVGRFLAGALGRDLPPRIDFLRVVDFCKETYDDDRTLVAVKLRGEDEPERLD
jgi:serine/threonine protein phosphatase PrpC